MMSLLVLKCDIILLNDLSNVSEDEFFEDREISRGSLGGKSRVISYLGYLLYHIYQIWFVMVK